MKRFNKLIFILMIVCLALVTADFFKPTNYSFADDSPIITIDPVPTVDVYDESVNFFTLTATVSNSQTLTGTDIQWLLNGSVITDLTLITIPSATPNVSVLKIYRSAFNSVTALDVWTFIARVRTQTEFYAQTTVNFKTSVSLLTIQPLSATVQSYSPNDLLPFIFNVSGLEEEEDIQWYILDNSNKYIKASGTSATTRTYTFTPTSVGSYVFKAKVGTEISEPFTVTVSYVPITEIDVIVSLQTENRNGFNTYLFRITNLDATSDIANINWYIEGYSTPTQYGGTTFLFQPTQYGTYRIVARYNDNIKIQSTTHTIEIKIDRTAEILTGAGIAVGIMGIGLVILIIKNVKSEKIW